MTWQTFYLGSFLLGLLLTVVTLLAGFVHLPIGHGLHLPHLPQSGGHGIGHGIGHGGVGGTAGGAHGQAVAHSHGPARDGLSPLNFATAMAFLAWFGGAGYLATSRANAIWLVALVIASTAGLLGAGIVFGFLTRVLARHEAALDPADYEMVGTLARVIVPIRDGGTGEISFARGRARGCSGARLDPDGAGLPGQTPDPRDQKSGRASEISLPRGAEVFVTRYEKGIAYVRPFEADEL